MRRKVRIRCLGDQDQVEGSGPRLRNKNLDGPVDWRIANETEIQVHEMRYKNKLQDQIEGPGPRIAYMGKVQGSGTKYMDKIKVFTSQLPER